LAEASIPPADPVARAVLALGPRDLHLRVQVRSGHPFLNSGEDSQLLFKTGAAIDLQLETGANVAADRTAPAPGDVRVLLALFGGQPVAVIYRYRVPGATAPVKFASPTGAVLVDQVERLDQARVTVTRTDDGYAVVAALPRAALGLTHAKTGDLRGDIGVILSDPEGRRNVARYYRFNQQAQVVVDVPSEVRIDPSKWGRLRLD
jgi:hypothetical protein